MQIAYSVDWKDPWEPFYIAPNHVPLYDERFKQVYELSNKESAVFIVRIKPNQPTKECGISTLSEVFVN